MEDGLQDPLWSFRISGHTFWIDQRTITFQCYINKILAEKLNVFVIVYFDDMLIYTENEAKKHVQAV